jgi:flagellar capping protein FliD
LAERLNDIIGHATGTFGSIAIASGIREASREQSTLFRQIQANQNRMSEMLDYLTKREEYYFKMFGRMEAAMMQSSNQVSYLMSMLGQGMM